MDGALQKIIKNFKNAPNWFHLISDSFAPMSNSMTCSAIHNLIVNSDNEIMKDIMRLWHMDLPVPTGVSSQGPGEG